MDDPLNLMLRPYAGDSIADLTGMHGVIDKSRLSAAAAPAEAPAPAVAPAPAASGSQRSDPLPTATPCPIWIRIPDLHCLDNAPPCPQPTQASRVGPAAQRLLGALKHVPAVSQHMARMSRHLAAAPKRVHGVLKQLPDARRAAPWAALICVTVGAALLLAAIFSGRPSQQHAATDRAAAPASESSAAESPPSQAKPEPKASREAGAEERQDRHKLATTGQDKQAPKLAAKKPPTKNKTPSTTQDKSAKATPKRGSIESKADQRGNGLRDLPAVDQGEPALAANPVAMPYDYPQTATPWPIYHEARRPERPTVEFQGFIESPQGSRSNERNRPRPY